MTPPLRRLADKIDSEAGSGPLTHVIIARATDDHGSVHCQVKVTLRSEPDVADLENAEQSVRQAYEWAFGEPPARVGASTLPWVRELDEDDDLVSAGGSE